MTLSIGDNQVENSFTLRLTGKILIIIIIMLFCLCPVAGYIGL